MDRGRPRGTPSRVSGWGTSGFRPVSRGREKAAAQPKESGRPASPSPCRVPRCRPACRAHGSGWSAGTGVTLPRCGGILRAVSRCGQSHAEVRGRTRTSARCPSSTARPADRNRGRGHGRWSGRRPGAHARSGAERPGRRRPSAVRNSCFTGTGSRGDATRTGPAAPAPRTGPDAPTGVGRGPGFVCLSGTAAPGITAPAAAEGLEDGRTPGR